MKFFTAVINWCAGTNIWDWMCSFYKEPQTDLGEPVANIIYVFCGIVFVTMAIICLRRDLRERFF